MVPGQTVSSTSPQTKLKNAASMIDADVAWVQRDGGGTVFRLSKPAVKTV